MPQHVDITGRQLSDISGSMRLQEFGGRHCWLMVQEEMLRHEMVMWLAEVVL